MESGAVGPADDSDTGPLPAYQFGRGDLGVLADVVPEGGDGAVHGAHPEGETYLADVSDRCGDGVGGLLLGHEDGDETSGPPFLGKFRQVPDVRLAYLCYWRDFVMMLVGFSAVIVEDGCSSAGDLMAWCVPRRMCGP